MSLFGVRHYDWNRGINILAHGDGYVHDAEGCLCLLSLAGPDSAGKGISSAIATGREIEILADSPLTLQPSWWGKYRILSARLPSGHLHQIVALEGFFGAGERGKLFLVEPEQSPAELAFPAIHKAVGTPLIPAWKDWLFARLTQEESIKELPGTLRAFHLQVSDAALDALVSDAVRSGALSF